MYQQPDPFVLFAYVLLQAAAPVAYVAAFVWLALKAGSLLSALVSPNADLRRRAQRHRHRLENMAALMTVAGVAFAAFLIWQGHGAGPYAVKLPGEIEIEGVGVGVVVLAFASSCLWMVLNSKGQDGSERPDVPQEGAPGDRPDWLAGMTFGKAGLITLALLPFLQVFAIPIGAFLAWKALQNQSQP